MSGSVDDFDSIVDPSHRLSALRVYLKDDRTELARDLISRLETRLATEMPTPVRVEISGSLASAHAMNEVMVHGKIRNVVQIAAFVFFVASLVLRSWTGGLLVVSPLVFAVLTNFAAMALLGIPLDIGTSAISAMAVGIGADYAIYFLYRLREELAGDATLEEALRRTLRTSGKAILFVSSAIAAGYLTLCFSGFGYHVRLGSLVAFAMIVSSVASLTVLPAAVWRWRPRFLVRGAASYEGSREAIGS
jgi:predicted RND superfamily exporter protein